MLSALIDIQRSYPAVPYQTTGTPVAAEACSFRTYASFLSDKIVTITVTTPLADIDQTGSRRSEPS
jgi:hypothetical protein